MNTVILREILIMKLKNKRLKKEDLLVSLLELILMKTVINKINKIVINKIHRHIKKTSKRSLIHKTSKKLLELDFKSNHSTKSIALKYVVDKTLPSL